MKSAFGKVPNIYATLALNETALADYLALQNRKSTLSAKEREIINLVVSQVNDCKYCVPAHTAVGKIYGFTGEQILEIRRAQISFDSKFDALAKFVKETAINRGRPSEIAYDNFFNAGYTKANLIDVMIIIGDKVISNYFHNVVQIPVDWDDVPKI
jgi:AhpD family alkylhydroperoxidase